MSELMTPREKAFGVLGMQNKSILRTYNACPEIQENTSHCGYGIIVDMHYQPRHGIELGINALILALEVFWRGAGVGAQSNSLY